MNEEKTVTVFGWCKGCQHQVPSSKSKLTPATKRIWCPTWLGSQDGPINDCDDCSAVFTDANKYGRGDGSFHWGEEADRAFKSVELNIPHTDLRYENAKGMVLNGTQIARHNRYEKDDGLYVVDGKVWLIAVYNVLRLGDVESAREMFPKLFVSRPRRVRSAEEEKQVIVPAIVKSALEGKEFETDIGFKIRLSQVTDYVMADNTINIPNAYAVCNGVCLGHPDWREFIVFDTGEVNNDGDQRIGFWNDCPLIDHS